jgi:hypothetical protein
MQLNLAPFAIALVACAAPSASPTPAPVAAVMPSSTAASEAIDASFSPEDAGASDAGGLGLAFGGGGPSTVSLDVDHPVVVGKVSAEAVEHIVRINYGRFRLCYEKGLRNDPTLAGRVGIKFTIDTQGFVKAVSESGSTLPAKDTIACIERSFTALSFPAPSSGTASVSYPLVLAPHR